jgi:flagellar basal body-associated protein FliL
LKELADVEKRESIRDEIAGKVGDVVKEVPLKHVYFSKFIIQ